MAALHAYSEYDSIALPSESAGQSFLFVDYAPTGTNQQNDKKTTNASVRSQAARASAKARLETMRRRAEDRPARRGQRVFPVCKPQDTDPVPRNRDKIPARKAAQEEQPLVLQTRQDSNASITLHAHKLFGGVIPVAAIDAATLGHFLGRFSRGTATERPWVQLVTTSVGSGTAPDLILKALQANASALCANDLQQPEFHRHATKQYLSAIVEVQVLLKSRKWSDSVVLYTCMIMTLFECIQSNNTGGQHAHVRGVAYLYQQKGPHAFAYGLEHKTFRYYRINMLMSALVDRKASFLAESDWKTIPFSGDGPPKTMLDLLIDILLELPGVLGAVEALKTSDLGRYSLIQQAFKLAYWVRCLIYDLETWKESQIWAHPSLSSTLRLKQLHLHALCDLATTLSPYQPSLGESLLCYCAAHLILTRIAFGMAQKSSVIAMAVRPPYTLAELVQAIILVSERQLSAGNVEMVGMIVTTFALKAALTTTELGDEGMTGRVRELLDGLNEAFAGRYNIHYKARWEG